MDFFFLRIEESLGLENKFVKLNKLLNFNKFRKLLKSIHLQDSSNKGGLWGELVFNYKNYIAEELYIKAIGLFLNMARTQFFFTANKRLGILLMNGILLSQGYLIINIPIKK